jgi:hypothetical protein
MLEGCEAPAERNGICASHNQAARKAERNAGKEKKVYQMPKVSKKKQKENSAYQRAKDVWIKDKPCAVFPKLKAIDIHHKKGRQGYADQWARDRDINLTMDQRFWLPVSREGHIEIESNPQWAKDNGFSLSRTEIIDEERPTI